MKKTKIITFLTGMASIGAIAQTDVRGLEEIIVVAERRSESLQKVPIAISAISEQGLKKAGIDSTNQVAMAVPGLTMTMNRSVVQPYLRGVGTQNSVAGEEGSIAAYVDGVYVSSLAAATFAMNNIERIEVLKGPQGTLFGRNATGGLIHVVTKDPVHDPVLDTSISVGNYDTWNATAYGSMGLTDNVAMDLAIYAIEQGKGWGSNLLLNEDVNMNEEWSIRSKMLIDATEKLTLRVTADYNRRESDFGYSRGVYPGSKLLDGTVHKGTIYDIQTNVPRDVTMDQWGLSLKADYDLGGATFTSTSAYRYAETDALFDQDGSPTKVVDVVFPEKTESAQQEFLFLGSALDIDYTAGIFLFYSKAEIDPLALSSALLPHLNVDRFTEQTTYSYSAFLQGAYNVSDSLKFTAGVRFTRDEKEIKGRDVATIGNLRGQVGDVLAEDERSANFNKVTWRTALEYSISDDVMAFASYSRGFKSGVFNGVNFLNQAVDPETLDAAEIGIKSDLFSNILRLNASVFHYDYENIQLFRVEGGVTNISNAAKGRVIGGDLEAIFLPTVPKGFLQLSAAVSILDAEYKRFPGASFSVPASTGGNVIFNDDASGNDMIRTPPATATLSVEYVLPVAMGEIDMNLHYYYNDGFYWDPDNRLKQEDYGILNTRISLRPTSEKWQVAIFGRNIANEKYFTQVTTANLGDLSSPGAPRTYGMSLDYKFF